MEQVKDIGNAVSVGVQVAAFRQTGGSLQGPTRVVRGSRHILSRDCHSEPCRASFAVVIGCVGKLNIKESFLIP